MSIMVTMWPYFSPEISSLYLKHNSPTVVYTPQGFRSPGQWVITLTPFPPPGLHTLVEFRRGYFRLMFGDSFFPRCKAQLWRKKSSEMTKHFDTVGKNQFRKLSSSIDVQMVEIKRQKYDTKCVGKIRHFSLVGLNRCVCDEWSVLINWAKIQCELCQEKDFYHLIFLSSIEYLEQQVIPNDTESMNHFLMFISVCCS